MNTLRASHATARGSFIAASSGSGRRSRRATSRSNTIGLYGHLNKDFYQYVHDVPEATFPTFLESLLYERITAEGPEAKV